MNELIIPPSFTLLLFQKQIETRINLPSAILKIRKFKFCLLSKIC